jgi:hypothetical protein
MAGFEVSTEDRAMSREVAGHFWPESMYRCTILCICFVYVDGMTNAPS